MLGAIPEPDWRHFKQVHAVLMERHCQQTLDQMKRLLDSSEGTAHARYGRAFELLTKRGHEMARLFDDFRRSTAVMQLAIMRRDGLLADSELGVFSEQTRQMIEGIASL